MGNKFGFIAKGLFGRGKVYLIRCPKCLRENYAINVSSGICTWCGYNGNEEKEKFEDEKLKDSV